MRLLGIWAFLIAASPTLAQSDNRKTALFPIEATAYGFSVSTTNQHAAYGSREGEIGVIDFTTGMIVHRIQVGRQVAHCAISSTARMIAAVLHNETTIRLWELESGKEAGILEGHKDIITALTFSTKGMLISGSWDRTIRVWQVSGGRRGRITELATKSPVTALSYSGTRLAAAQRDAAVTIWEIAESVGSGPRARADIPPPLVELPDGRTTPAPVVQVPMQYTFTAKPASTISRPDNNQFALSIAFSPDGKLLAFGGGDAGSQRVQLLIHDADTGEEVAVLRGHFAVIRGIHWLSPTSLVSIAEDRTVRVWTIDPTTKSAKQTKMFGFEEEYPLHIWATPQGDTALVAVRDRDKVGVIRALKLAP